MSLPVTLDYSNPSLLVQRSKALKGGTNKIRRIDIVFNNDSGPQPGLYTSGTNMAGYIYLDVVKPIKIVRVRFKVECNIRVSDTKNNLLEHNMVLYGTETGRKSADRLAPRIYQFPFSVELPTDLPTSIGRSSKLIAAYKVTAMVIRPSQMDDIVIERPFIVHNVSDEVLTGYADGQSAAHQEFSFKGAPIHGRIILPRTAFFLGEKLKVITDVSNDDSSSRRVKVSVKIVRTVLGRGHSSYGLFKLEDNQSYTTVITDRTSEFTKIPKRTSETSELEIPLTVMEPTSKHKLIDIEYTCYVSVIKEGVFGEGKPKVSIFPIIIAPPTNIALYPMSYAELSYEGDNDSILAGPGPSAPSLYPDLSMNGAQPSAPDMDSDDESLMSAHGNLHLPSYDEVMAMNTNAPALPQKS